MLSSTFLLLYSLFLLFTLPSCQSGKEAAKPPVRLGPEVKAAAAEILASLEEPVTVRIYRGGEGESSGEEAQALVDLIAETSSMVSVERVDLPAGVVTTDLGVSRGPVIEMRGSAPGTLRYYGFPERKEVRPFLEGILSASGRRTRVAPEVESYIAGLEKEVLIRIFTTPD